MDIILNRIIDEMKAQRKKQFELTDFLGLNHNTFGNWKSGLNSSYKKYLHAIANFLGVSVEYLKGETEDKTPPAQNSEGSLDDELIRRLCLLTPEEQRRVDDFVQGILASR